MTDRDLSQTRPTNAPGTAYDAYVWYVRLWGHDFEPETVPPARE